MSGRAEWYAPDLPAGLRKVIRVLNSLTGEKNELVPRTPLHVSWYTCGPTVYDSAHLGHARAYVTFDIIRRILDDYFGIHVFYVMNITDIDDKIILRARRNFLFDQYLSEVALKAPSEFIKDAKNAFEEAMHVLEVKVENLEVKAKEIDSRRHQKELNEQIQGEKLKLKNIQTEYEKFQAVERENPTDLVQKLAPLCKDVISQRIDREKGSSVSDLSIFQKHAFHFESEFLEDMKNLGVREPDVLTRVSEYIPHIVDYIKKIIDRGFAYESNGSVYFDVVKFSSPDSGHVYAKLSPWSVGNLELLGEGEGALGTSETEKRSSGDFALWKKSKPGEPYWESPWGNGRPGWHIECSAMASDILGSNFDIHSGGEDLMFPHHDNEIAQSEAYYDNQQWVNYFWHAGHLSIEGLKMSKSLKNFITIKQALQTHSSRQIRMAFLLQSWHATMNYSDEALKEAVSKEKKFREFFLQVQTFLRKGLGSNQAWTDTDKVLHADLIQAQSDVHERLLDNFDYPSAIDILLSLVTKSNVYMNANVLVKSPLLQKIAGYVNRMLKVFGVLDNDSMEMISRPFGKEQSESVDKMELLAPYLDCLTQFRDQIRLMARQSKHTDYLEICDSLRDERLPVLGVRLEDKADESVWKLVDPQELQEEIRRKLADQLKKKREKIISTISSRQKNLQILEKGLLEPSSVFDEDGDSYSIFDDQGIPTHDKEGNELPKKARKKLQSRFEKQKVAYTKASEKLRENPSVLDDLKREISELESQLKSIQE